MTDDLPRGAPMAPDVAQNWFRRLLARGELRLAYARHAEERLAERGLPAEAVHRLLREGEVPRVPRRVDGLGRSKYTLEGAVLDDEPRRARMVVLAAPRSPVVRVLTVMWVDEP